MLCKLSTKDRVCMKCNLEKICVTFQTLFPVKNKKKIKMLFAEILPIMHAKCCIRKTGLFKYTENFATKN